MSRRNPPLYCTITLIASVAKSSPVAAPAPTEGSDAGGVGDAPTTAGGPTLLPLTCVPPVTSAAGTAAGMPPPRKDVAAAADVAAAHDEDMGGMPPPRGAANAAGARADESAGRTSSPREDIQDAPAAAAPDEDMGGMPPQRGAADAAGVAAGIPPPREDVAVADGSGAASGEDAVDGHGCEEVTAPLSQVGTIWKTWRRYPKVQYAKYVARPAGVMTLWESEEWSLPEFR